VERALEDDLSARRFATRSGAAVQATVGLNQALATQVAKVLRSGLEIRAENRQTRTTAALAIAELDLADADLGNRAAEVLVEALQQSDPLMSDEELVRNIVRVARHLLPKQAGTCLGRTATVLTEALAKESDPFARAGLERGLAEVCKALPPEEAATHL